MSERMGRYELIAPRPGQENTFLARRRGAGAFERYVVVRIVDLEGDQGAMLRLQADEVLWPLGRLHHQHFRNVMDVEEHADKLLIVTEYVHGCTIRDVLEGGAQLPYDFGLTVVAHAAAALHHMHTRTMNNGKPLALVHREVSPATLWVGYEGAVKLALAIPLARTVAPSVAYLSPEQVSGKPVGVCSDVWSLGAVLYELTTGQPAFLEATERESLARIKSGTYVPPSQVIGNFPPELEAIITRCLQVEPGARYESAEAMRSAISALGHHYELVLGDGAIVEVMSQLFETPIEPWLQGAAPEPAAGAPPAEPSALGFDFDLPSVRPRKNPMRSATELVEELASILEPSPSRPRTPAPELPEAHSEFDEAAPTRAAETPPEILAAATPVDPPADHGARVQSIQRLFTESAFDPRETPAIPLARLDDKATRPVTNLSIVDELATTTGGVELVPSPPSVPVPAPAPSSTPSRRDRRVLWIALGGLVVVGLGVGVWLAIRGGGSGSTSPANPDAPAASVDSAVPDRAPDAPVAVVDAAASKPPPPPPPPDAGGPQVKLLITSVPSNATVLLDGKRLGKTPFDATVELVGKPPHAVKVRLTGYNTVKLDITGDVLEKEVVMTKPKPKPEEAPGGVEGVE